jgi:hypothetical protein
MEWGSILNVHDDVRGRRLARGKSFSSIWMGPSTSTDRRCHHVVGTVDSNAVSSSTVCENDSAPKWKYVFA